MGYPGQGQQEGEGSGAVRGLTDGSSHLSQPCPFLWRDAVDNGPIRALIESLTHQPLAAANEGIQGITASIIKFDFWMWLCQQWALVRVFRKMWQSRGGVARARGMAVPQRCSYRACFTWLHITSPEAAGALKTRQRPTGPHATLPELCSLLKMQLLLCPHSCFLHKYCHSWWSSLVPSAKVKVLVTPSRSTFCYPMDYSPPGSRPWNSPGKNTGVGCHSFLHGVFPTQGSNPGLLHCRQIIYHLNHLGRLSAKIIPSVLSTPSILSVTEPLKSQLVNISWFLFPLPFPPYYFSSSTCHHHRIGHLEKLFSPSPVHLLLPVQIILFLKSKFDCPSSKPCRDPFSLQEKVEHHRASMILDPYTSPSYSLIPCFSNLAGATVPRLPFPKVRKCWTISLLCPCRYVCLECLPHWGACTCLLSLHLNEVSLTHSFFPGSPVHIFLIVPNHTRIIIIYLSSLLDYEIIMCFSFCISFWKCMCLTHQRCSGCCHHYNVCRTSGLERW